MQELRSSLKHHPFGFGVFSLGGEVEYLFGEESNPSEFPCAAEQLCRKRVRSCGPGRFSGLLSLHSS
jgi:hypothetical protein